MRLGSTRARRSLNMWRDFTIGPVGIPRWVTSAPWSSKSGPLTQSAVSTKPGEVQYDPAGRGVDRSGLYYYRATYYHPTVPSQSGSLTPITPNLMTKLYTYPPALRWITATSAGIPGSLFVWMLVRGELNLDATLGLG